MATKYFELEKRFSISIFTEFIISSNQLSLIVVSIFDI